MFYFAFLAIGGKADPADAESDVAGRVSKCVIFDPAALRLIKSSNLVTIQFDRLRLSARASVSISATSDFGSEIVIVRLSFSLTPFGIGKAYKRNYCKTQLLLLTGIKTLGYSLLMFDASEERQTVTISNVPAPLLEAIKRLAESEHRPVSNFLRQALERIVAEHQAREALGRGR